MSRLALNGAVLAFLTACAPAPTVGAPPASFHRHVVVITVDGLRPDAIAAAPANHIQRLKAAGVWSYDARATDPLETLPNHVSMATGLLTTDHGITHNKDRGGTLLYPTVFSRVREAGGRSGNYVGKSKLSLLSAPDHADTVWGAGQNGMGDEGGLVSKVAARFAADFPRERFNFTWVHLREPDWEGHNYGWMSDKYLAAVRESDAAVGVILKAIADSAIANSTAVILTSDHGGENDSHGSGGGKASYLIPWICRVPGLSPHKISGGVRTVDVAPTVLALLGLPPLPGVDGKAVRACLPR